MEVIIKKIYMLFSWSLMISSWLKHYLEFWHIIIRIWITSMVYQQWCWTLWMEYATSGTKCFSNTKESLSMDSYHWYYSGNVVNIAFVTASIHFKPTEPTHPTKPLFYCMTLAGNSTDCFTSYQAHQKDRIPFTDENGGWQPNTPTRIF